MIFIVLGFSLLAIGAVSINFVILSKLLQVHDKNQWSSLGSPQGRSFIDLGKTLGLFSWVLNRGYEQSVNEEIRRQGRVSRARAVFARYSLLVGVACLSLGFILALAGI